MNKIIALLITSTLILIGCSTATKKESKTTKADSSILQPKPIQIDPLELARLEKIRKEKQLKVASFYQNIPACTATDFALKDLMVNEIRLSNNDLSTVATTLEVMGYRVIDLQSATQAATKFSCDQLPVIVVPARATKQKLDFQPIQSTQGNSTSIKTLSESNAAEIDRFIVYYHPGQVNQFEKLNWLVTDKIDVPAAQVYIETMVLEVRQEDSEEFGIDFSKADGDKSISLGSLVPGSTTLEFINDSTVDADGNSVFTPGYGKRARLKALIDEGKAEVLSRPSILTLSNRQAVIQVVDVIQTPELSSTLSSNGELNISAYQFNPLLIGITLNLRPRVSADRKWLSLEIDATVEAEDDENTGEVFASTDDGEQVLLAEKQGSNSKNVKTFVRIPDRTPIIIGGLVGTQNEERKSKVPFLGDIPGIGKLFTSIDNEVQKREIIIVLTPYILAEDYTSVNTLQLNETVNEKMQQSLLFHSQQNQSSEPKDEPN